MRDAKWQSNEFAASPEGKAEFLEIFNRLAMHRTKAQLYDAAKQVRIPLCPVNNSADLVNSPHLPRAGLLRRGAAPGDRSDADDARCAVQARRFAQPGATARARLGEHNAEVLDQLATNAVGGI